MKRTLDFLKNIGNFGKKKQEKEPIDFWWKLKEIWENEYVFESYGQKIEIKKYDEWLFSIPCANMWSIIDTESNIKFIADFMNRGKQIALDGYHTSDKSELSWISFTSYEDFPDTNVEVIFSIEEQYEPEELEWVTEYESWYWVAKSVIDEEIYKKMPEKYLIHKNKATIVEYLNIWAKSQHLDDLSIPGEGGEA